MQLWSISSSTTQYESGILLDELEKLKFFIVWFKFQVVDKCFSKKEVSQENFINLVGTAKHFFKHKKTNWSYLHALGSTLGSDYFTLDHGEAGLEGFSEACAAASVVHRLVLIDNRAEVQGKMWKLLGPVNIVAVFSLYLREQSVCKIRESLNTNFKN